MDDRGWKRTVICAMTGFAFLWCVALPGIASGDDDVKMLKQRLEQMSKEMEAIQKKLEDLEKKNEAKTEEITEMDDRINKAELHTATDKIALGVELRSRGDSLHYKDIQMAPASLTNMFFGNYPAGFNGAAPAQAQPPWRVSPPPV